MNVAAPGPDHAAAHRLAEAVREALGVAEPPALAIVTGSGLGGLVQLGDTVDSVDYGDLPGLPPPGRVAGHGGRWHLVECAGRRVFVLVGRRHLYEGLEPAGLVPAVRALAALGTPRLILTNAAGGLAERLGVGGLMLIRDHINLMFANPLVGPNDAGLGSRFPDLCDAWDVELSDALIGAARAERLALHEGVYVALSGPTYETRAEVRMLQRLGGDAVGMSTVPELLAARHAGLRVAGVSLITNTHVRAADPPTHEEVLEMAGSATARLVRLLRRVVLESGVREG